MGRSEDTRPRRRVILLGRHFQEGPSLQVLHWKADQTGQPAPGHLQVGSGGDFGRTSSAQGRLDPEQVYSGRFPLLHELAHPVDF